MQKKYELDHAQRQAVMHYEKPCLVLAGPGSGKTTVIVERVKYLIERHKVPPASILVITYTKAAAHSMESRFREAAGGRFWPVTFGTFHSIFYHILKEHYHLKQDCLLRTDEKLSIMYSLLKKQNKERELAEEVLEGISLYRNRLPGEAFCPPPGFDRETFAQILTVYDQEKKRLGKIDFDDMLVRCLWLLRGNPRVLARWQKQFPYILVDEFQDCSRVQYEVLGLLAEPLRNLFVVGDDDQAIYGFRGASPGILRQFCKDYAGEKIVLAANYRSREAIVQAAERVIRENGDRFEKGMYAAGKIQGEEGQRAVSIRAVSDRAEQSAYLAARLLSLSKTYPWEELAVICRTNRQIEYILPYLQTANIPFVVRGRLRSRYSHFAVQDIISYLQLAMGKRERGLLLQVMNRPYRGIGREMLWEETTDLKLLANKLLQEGMAEQAEKVKRLEKSLNRAGNLSPHLAIRLVRRVIGYEDWLKEKAGKQAERYEEWRTLLDEVEQEAKGFSGILEWLAFVEKEKKAVESSRFYGKAKGVQLLTMHASKGLEFACVCLPDVNEGIVPYGKIPDKAAEEEERRLFFVAMTRAKTALDILYLAGNREHPGLPSRFLKPLMEAYSSSPSTSSSNS